MKHLITIFFLFLLISCNKELPKNGRIEIIPTYCKYDNEIHFSSNKFKLFLKGENDTEIKLTEENNIPGTSNSKVSNLEYGNYYIQYVTIYNHKNITYFKVNQSNLKKVEICFDYLDYKENKNVLMIDELKNGDTLTLNFFHEGCFDTFDKAVELNIVKNDEKITIDFNNKEYKLTNSQIKLLREFEIELRSNHRAGCTSIDKYTLWNRNSYTTYEESDGSCEWYGFKNLIKTITGK